MPNSFLYPMVCLSKTRPKDPLDYLYCYAHEGVHVVLDGCRVFNTNGVLLEVATRLPKYPLLRYPMEGVLLPSDYIVIEDVILDNSPLWERQELLNIVRESSRLLTKCDVKVALYWNLVDWPQVNEFVARAKGLGYVGLWMKRKDSLYQTSTQHHIKTDDWFLLTEETNDE